MDTWLEVVITSIYYINQLELDKLITPMYLYGDLSNLNKPDNSKVLKLYNSSLASLLDLNILQIEPNNIWILNQL
ncbi:hypothetical protein C2G38_2190987 [Gigaspora rosea]|uniref:Uncharacterized protein n=1 Tax=Gigaspora rosea TaxID=44941 RepID=A0A397V562_9GLOM|nr:hypothetical protein C2G38_2190987 [Gigaspora rosea]